MNESQCKDALIDALLREQKTQAQIAALELRVRDQGSEIGEMRGKLLACAKAVTWAAWLLRQPEFAEVMKAVKWGDAAEIQEYITFACGELSEEDIGDSGACQHWARD